MRLLWNWLCHSKYAFTASTQMQGKETDTDTIDAESTIFSSNNRCQCAARSKQCLKYYFVDFDMIFVVKYLE